MPKKPASNTKIELPPDLLNAVDNWARGRGMTRDDAVAVLVRNALKALDVANMGRRR